MRTRNRRLSLRDEVRRLAGKTLFTIEGALNCNPNMSEDEKDHLLGWACFVRQVAKEDTRSAIKNALEMTRRRDKGLHRRWSVLAWKYAKAHGVAPMVPQRRPI